MIIKNIIGLLQIDDFKEGSIDIQIAKGLNKIPNNPKEAIKQAKTTLRLKRNK